MDDVLDFIYRRHLAIWSNFFRSCLDAGDASGIAGAKRGNFWGNHCRHNFGRKAKFETIFGIVVALAGILVILGAPSLDGQMLSHAGIAWGAFLGFWSGVDPAAGRGAGWIPTDRVAWGYGWTANAVGVFVA